MEGEDTIASIETMVLHKILTFNPLVESMYIIMECWATPGAYTPPVRGSRR